MILENISTSFQNLVYPILDTMKADGYTVSFQPEFTTLADGRVPRTIAVYPTKFAYTLTLKDVLNENFGIETVRVITQQPADVASWLDYTG